MKSLYFSLLLALGITVSTQAADLVQAKDPENAKRYEGSQILAFQAPKYDEYFASTGKERHFGKRNTYGSQSLKLEGVISRWTYLVPDSEKTATEVFINYKREFERLGLETVYAPDPDNDGWFGPAYGEYADKAGLGQILAYDEDSERYLIAKTKDAQPTFYVLFVTAFKDGVIPPKLRDTVKKGMPLVQLDVIAPEAVQEKMVFVKAEEMQKNIVATGRIALYGLNFDTDKDILREDSRPSLDEVAKLLKNDPSLNLYVVGHTDNEGGAQYNLDLSRRRASNIVTALVTQYQINGTRLASAGGGLFSPIASNADESGRALNRRVELVKQ